MEHFETIFYAIDAAYCSKRVNRILSDDTDVFVPLVSWVCLEEMESKVQVKRWFLTVLDINATCTDLGPHWLQYHGMHALSNCDMASYQCAKQLAH